MWLGRTRRVHFVGVGGIGMSGIAELLVNLGYEVSGSDARRSDITDRLSALGVRVMTGHDRRHVGDADVVVVSSAIATENPEVVEARSRHVPVIPRAEMLAELMRLRVGIAVAGAHGKTTTTSMIALLLERAGLDPTAVIGGRLSAFGSNARLGRGQYIVVEADESDRSFLKLTPAIAVITNIDREHMEAYGSFDGIVDAFQQFADRIPFYGAVVACADNPAVRALLPTLAQARDYLRVLRGFGRSGTGARNGRRVRTVPGSLQSARCRRKRRRAAAPPQCAGPPQPAERAGGSCGRRRARDPFRSDQCSARGLPRRRAPLSSCAARRGAFGSSMTMAITPPRSRRCSRQPAGAIRRGSSRCFSPTGSLALAI